MPDLDQAAGVLDPRGRVGLTGFGDLDRRVGGLERIARQNVLDVHEQELLVLLLMVQPEIDEVRDFRGQRTVEQPGHRLVDVASVLGHFGHAGP